MSTIKISELADGTITLDSFLALANSSGVAFKGTVDELQTFVNTISVLGLKAAVSAADAAPTEDGLFPCQDTGTYTNFGGLVVDISDTITFISVSGTQTVFKKVEIPITITIDATPTEGSVNAVQSGGVFSYSEALAEAKVLPERLKINQILNPTTQLTEILNNTVSSNTTGVMVLFNVEAGKKYIINATSSATLSSGLKYYLRDDNGLNVIKDYPSSTNFASGVSFNFVADSAGTLEWRVYSSGLSVDFIVTEDIYISVEFNNLKKFNNFKEEEFLYKITNLAITGTGSQESLPIKGFENTIIDAFIQAPYNGRFVVYSREDPYTGLTFLADITTDFTNGHSFKFTIPENADSLNIRTFQAVTINEFNIKTDKLKSVFQVKGNLWYDSIGSFYGDSITAISNGDFLKPYYDLEAWGRIVGRELELSNIHGRGIGGSKYDWASNGGSVAFANTSTGQYTGRNDGFNYDNYLGNVTVPTGSTAIRACFCSWLRIKTMFPASIKDNVKFVFIMGGTNDSNDSTALSWVDTDTTDTEWAASTQYSAYNGDFNIETLKGGLASTIMKMQVWMPQALIVVGTPLSGRGATGQLNFNPITDEYNKSVHIREVLNILSIPLIDVNAESGINGLNRTTYISDSVHPYTINGNEMLARTVIGGFRKLAPIKY
jgi:hypothetical protein